ncbi:MAG: UDP-N-acetylmuramate dehydrogenase [Desulfobulbaceae bacterium]|nr:UDP-N-acetylmuramate dehydrogenase [Desulfobulbaceae bacterium]
MGEQAAMQNAISSYKPQLSMDAQKALCGFCVVTPRWHEPMASHCTLRAGGRAEAFIEVSTIRELSVILGYLDGNKISYRIIGKGSNILVPESGLPGVTIRLVGDFQSISPLKAKNDLRVGAGCSMNRLLAYCMKNDLGGVEFLAGIPGSLGGGIYMNAGAYGQDLSKLTDWVETIDKDGKISRLSASELDFSYRHSIFQEESKRGHLILFVGLTLKARPSADVRQESREFLRIRAGKQPSIHGSAGSFFKNPVGDFAGRLIEAAGLKGYSRGHAMVSPVHANFIINTGEASVDDISALMLEVQQKVFAESGVLLEPEVRFLS